MKTGLKLSRAGRKMTTKRKRGGGKSASSLISVQRSTVVKRGKKDSLVKEEYKPTGKGRAKTGYTATKASPKARNASQTGRSNQTLDKKRAARALSLIHI